MFIDNQINKFMYTRVVYISWCQNKLTVSHRLLLLYGGRFLGKNFFDILKRLCPGQNWLQILYPNLKTIKLHTLNCTFLILKHPLIP